MNSIVILSFFVTLSSRHLSVWWNYVRAGILLRTQGIAVLSDMEAEAWHWNYSNMMSNNVFNNIWTVFSEEHQYDKE